MVRLAAGRLRARDGVRRRPGRGGRGVRRTPARRWLHVVDLDGARVGDARARRRRRGDRRGGRGARVRSRSRAACATSRRSRRPRRGSGAGRRRDRRAARSGVRGPARRGATAPTAVAVAIDVRDGRAVGRRLGRPDAAGRRRRPRRSRRLADEGVTTFEVTAIERDGLLGGPDLALYRRLVASAAARSSRPAGSRRSTTCSRSATSAAPARSSDGRSTRAGSTWPTRSRPRAPADGAARESQWPAPCPPAVGEFLPVRLDDLLGDVRRARPRSGRAWP